MSVDEVLEKLIRDVEASVHALYRGDVRQNTQRVKSDSLRSSARQSLLPFLAATAESGAASASSSGETLTQEDAIAATRCVMAWQPMGGSSASPQSRCVPAAREMAPTWAEREKARFALKRIAG